MIYSFCDNDNQYHKMNPLDSHVYFSDREKIISLINELDPDFVEQIQEYELDKSSLNNWTDDYCLSQLVGIHKIISNKGQISKFAISILNRFKRRYNAFQEIEKIDQEL